VLLRAEIAGTMKNSAQISALRKSILRALNPEKQSGFSVREWLLAIFAGVGLCITLVTTWFSTLRTVDDVEVIFNDLPTMSRALEQLNVSPDMKMTFVNSGTRNAVILKVSLRVAEEEPCDTFTGIAASVDYDVEPFILKSNDVALRDAKFKAHNNIPPLLPIDAHGTAIHKWMFSDPPGATLEQKRAHNASVCLYIEFATPSLHKTAVLRMRYFDMKRDFLDDSAKPDSYDVSKPWPIVRENGTTLQFRQPSVATTYLKD
jgi:hypothetical protein